MPADGLADGVPDALRPGRLQARRHRAGAGRRRRRRHRADRAGAGRRPQGAGHQPRRVQAAAGARARCPRGVRDRPAAADHRRRGDGDRRPGDLAALDPVAAGRRHPGDERRDLGQRRRRHGPDPDLLPAAQGRRLDDGHPRRARVARLDARRDRRPPGHRPHAPDGARRARASPRWRRASSSARSSSPDEGAGHGRRLGHRRGHRRRPPRARRRPRAAGPQRAARRGPARAVRRRGRPRRRPGRPRDRGRRPWRTSDRLDAVVHVAGVLELAPVADLPARGPDRPADGQPGRARPS